MKFGAFAPKDAEGGIVVHSIRKDGLVLKKGTRVGPAEIDALAKAGIAAITVARLEPGDVSEDEAAGEIAAAVAGEGVRVDPAFTGRANLFAETGGVLVVDREAIDRLNEVDPDITLATLDAYAPVVTGKMIATVKIIPFAVSGAACDRAVAVARAAKPLVRLAPYRVKRVAVISTLLPGLTEKVIDKTLRVTAERLAPAGARIICAVSITASGMPASCMVGTSGMSNQWSLPVCASAFRAPERMWPISPAMLTHAMSVVPARAACSAGAAPVKGTCVMSISARSFSNSTASCDTLPRPGDA